MSGKKCKRCGFTNDGTGFHGRLCAKCRKLQRNEHYEENKDLLIGIQKEYYQNNKEEIKLQKRDYYEANKELILQNHREYEREKLHDPVFRLRKYASTLIRQRLQKQESSKFGESITEYLSYTIQELKTHLEAQFESWMNWNNQGKYDPRTWNDNDSSTWAWQLDHIVPQAALPYTSMADDNFRKCWSLNNLRPLNAKQNLLDGALRTRHGKSNEAL